MRLFFIFLIGTLTSFTLGAKGVTTLTAFHVVKALGTGGEKKLTKKAKQIPIRNLKVYGQTIEFYAHSVPWRLTWVGGKQPLVVNGVPFSLQELKTKKSRLEALRRKFRIRPALSFSDWFISQMIGSAQAQTFDITDPYAGGGTTPPVSGNDDFNFGNAPLGDLTAAPGQGAGLPPEITNFVGPRLGLILAFLSGENQTAMLNFAQVMMAHTQAFANIQSTMLPPFTLPPPIQWDRTVQ